MAMKLNSDDSPGGAAAVAQQDSPWSDGADYLPDHQRAVELRAQAARCRRLANSALDRRTLDALNGIARECEDEAERLGRAH